MNGVHVGGVNTKQEVTFGLPSFPLRRALEVTPELGQQGEEFLRLEQGGATHRAGWLSEIPVGVCWEVKLVGCGGVSGCGKPAAVSCICSEGTWTNTCCWSDISPSVKL